MAHLIQKICLCTLRNLSLNWAIIEILSWKTQIIDDCEVVIVKIEI